MNIARRVAVLGMNGMVLYYAHRKEAERLLDADQATAEAGRSITEIKICGALSSLKHPDKEAPSHPTLRNYMGQPTTFTQRLDAGRIVQHRSIDSSLRPLFGLSVTDCLVA